MSISQSGVGAPNYIVGNYNIHFPDEDVEGCRLMVDLTGLPELGLDHKFL